MHGAEPLGEELRHESLDRGRREPCGFSRLDVFAPARNVETEELRLFLLEILLLLHRADLVVGELRKLPRTFLWGEIEALRDVVEPRREPAEDFFVSPDGLPEDTDAQETAFEDLRIDGPGGDEVQDDDRLALLPVPIESADSCATAPALTGAAGAAVRPSATLTS